MPDAGARVLVLVHGLCMSDLQWNRDGHDHGVALAADLGFTPVYLHYNSGLHVSDNGRAFGEVLETLVASWPVPISEIAIVGHSMGGLVARSAYWQAAAAGHAWPGVLRAMVFLGTPHHGAPLERIGNWIDQLLAATPYTEPFARLGRVRSAGITDLRHGCLLEQDWTGHDRFVRRPDPRTPVPLPEGVECYAVAASLDATARRRSGPGDRRRARAARQRPRTDIVTRDSCWQFPDTHQWIARGTSHLDLLEPTRGPRTVAVLARQVMGPRPQAEPIYSAILPSTSHKSSHDCSSRQRKTCPLIRRQSRSMRAMAAMSSSPSGGITAARRFAR